MSAHARTTELDRLLDLGADMFMAKPFTLTDLEKVLSLILSGVQAGCVVTTRE